ncbi:hypothetical protein ACSTLM_00970, partial [Vibrio parahaemolyticus]
RDIFAEDEFARLAEKLAGIRGRFILSLNDKPEVRALFARFKIESVELHYGVGGGQRPAKEVLITGP